MARKLIAAKVISIAGAALLLIALLFFTHFPRTADLATKQQPQSNSSADPRLIYSANLNDPWNRIFRALFTRTITTRVSSEFAEGAPFVLIRDTMSPMKVSTRTFERLEIGDRAMDPLYPSFFNNQGVISVVTDPRYAELKDALTAALAESSNRSVASRALMQSDLWAAHDIIFAVSQFRGRPDKEVLTRRRDELLSLVARLIIKVGLKGAEIQLVPDTYRDATSRLDLPPLFAPDTQWIEVQMSPHRLHDFSSNYRRSARVFFKLSNSSQVKKNLLEEIRKGNFFSGIDAVALVVENMLVDQSGTVFPSRLAIDVQVRKFVKDSKRDVIATELHQYELSRRELVHSPNSGGLIEINKNHDLYLPAAGNDYRFASPYFTSKGNDYPVLVSLQQRCEACHGKNSRSIFTLSTHAPFPLPPIDPLSSTDNVHGWYVAGRKQEREDFKAMMELWRRSSRN